MGLDWMVEKRKAKPGQELQYKRLMAELKKLEKRNDELGNVPEAVLKSLNEEIDKVAVTAYDELGCPRIGIDAEATEWFRTNVYEPRLASLDEIKRRTSVDPRNQYEAELFEQERKSVEYWSQPFEEILKKETGKYVPDLAKVKEGIAAVSGMVFVSALDFRGKIVGYSRVVSEKSRSEAYQDHSAKECLAYAARMEKEVEQYVKTLPFQDKGDPDDVQVIRDAISWLRFWGERGFGYWAWY